MVYWNPRVVLNVWREVEQRNWNAVGRCHEQIALLHQFLHNEFGPKGFTDTAYDRMGGRASGFLKTGLRNRGPYPSATHDDVEALQGWYREHFPEMLEL